jgi:hypothetical protein
MKKGKKSASDTVGTFSGGKLFGIRLRLVLEWIVFLVVVVFVVFMLRDQGEYLRTSISQVQRVYLPSYGYRDNLRIEVFAGELVILNGPSAQLPGFAFNRTEDNFRWEIASIPSASCLADVGDNTAATDCSRVDLSLLRPSFTAPEYVGEYVFHLYFDHPLQGEILLAKFVVQVVSASLAAADFDDNGVLDRRDLVNLFQNWNSFPAVGSAASAALGYDVSNVLAHILRGCVDCRATPPTLSTSTAAP